MLCPQTGTAFFLSGSDEFQSLALLNFPASTNFLFGKDLIDLGAKTGKHSQKMIVNPVRSDRMKPANSKGLRPAYPSN